MNGTVLSPSGLSVDDDAAPASASTRFPNEIVENIAHLTTDSATLATWMRVSRTMYNIAAPRLYTKGIVTANGSLYVGVSVKEIGRSWPAVREMGLTLQISPSKSSKTFPKGKAILRAKIHPSLYSYRKYSCFR
jgi:hypothetical protein